MKNLPAPSMVLGCALVASLISCCLLRNGIQATPDSWAYWEGSVSMLEDARYTYLGGEFVRYWPPLFSAYLAVVQAILGKTGFALTVAMCCLTFAGTAAWSAFLGSYFDACLVPKNASSRWVAAWFVVFFTAYCSAQLLAQFLLLGFVGLMLFLLIQVPEAPARRYARLVLALAATQAGALLAHNSALMFVPAVIVILLADAPRKLRHRLMACGAFAVCGIAPYLGARACLQQTHSHPFGKPMFSLIEYLCQSLSGLGQFFSTTSSSPVALLVSAVLGLVIILLAVWSCLSTNGDGHSVRRIPVVVAVVSYLFLLLLFNLTWIDSDLRGRFLYHVPLCLIPVMCLQLSKARPWLLLIVCPLLLGAPGYRVLRWGSAGIVSREPVQRPAGFDVLDIRVNFFLTGRKTEAVPAGFVRVRPPTFKWMERWRSDEPSTSQQSVIIEAD